MAKRITVAKLLADNNEGLKKEIKTLKRTIKAQQNVYEKLRAEHIELDKKYSVINNSIKFDIVLEISKLIIAILVGFFTNLLTSELGN